MSEFQLDPRVPVPLIVLIGAALLVSSAISLWRLRSRVPLPGAVVLVGLRAFAVLALVIALLGPSAVSRETITIRPPVLLLADASGSMSLRDRPDRPPRRTQLALWARDARPALDRLRAKADVSLFDFGREPVAVSEFSETAGDRLTAVGDAISASLRRTRGRTGAALVVFSDGRNTFGGDPLRAAAQARERGVRVHAVVIGEAQNAMLRDRRITNLLCPSVAQVNSAVAINAFLAASGEKGNSMKVALRVDDQIVDARDVVADQDAFSTKLTFLYTPSEAGEKKVRVSVETVDGEFDASNNALDTLLRVTQKDLRILYIEGKLRWDYTFLRRALAQIPGAHFQTANLFADAAGGPGPRPEQVKDFNVVIVGDVRAASLTRPFIDALDQAVRERETGLLFLAGPSNLASDAGWRDTPMEAILPFELDGSKPPDESPTLVRLTSQGLSHFAVALERDMGVNMKTWQQMPKLEAVARVGQIKPGGFTLATTDADQPLLVTQTYGKGRVLAFLAETAWKWALESDESAERYRRFWHQCVLWLAKKEKQQKRIWLDLPRYLYLVGDPVEVTVTVEDPPGTPAPDASVQVTLEGPRGALPAQPAAYYGGAYHATLVPPEPGDYTVKVEARLKNEHVGSPAAKFHVVAPSAEFEQPGAAPEALMALATAGGGTCRALPDATSLIEALEREAQPARVERVQRRTLWDRAWLILLFVAALGVEWVLRKAYRLV